MYQAIAASVIGAAHIQDQLPCQDCSFAFTSASGLTAAIIAADGHGSRRHSRSDAGSKLACDAARKLMAWLEFFLPECPELIERNGSWIAGEIISYFKAYVDAHVLKHPLSEQEQRLAQAHGVYHLYGTTLLAVFSSPVYSFAMAVGDGVIRVIGEDGCMRELLPAPPTDSPSISPGSLCHLDERDFRFYSQKGPLQSAIVITDGIGNSFDDNGSELCSVLMEDMSRYDPEMHIHLRQLLTDITARGVGDDVSVAVFSRQSEK